MSYKVAIASTDGKVINQHFGKADRFHIVEISEEGSYQYIGTQNVVPGCNGGSHDTNAFDDILNSLKDVQVFLVSRIGEGAAAYLEQNDKIVYQAPYMIDQVLDKIIKDKIYLTDNWKPLKEDS